MSTRELVVVLDDDPTGTQSARDVTVVLEPSVAAFARALSDGDAVYVLTNTRALEEAAATALLRRVRQQVEQACAAAGARPMFVLRGDSTLRGHVFAESDVFLPADGVLVLVPAFPQGGRTTLDGVHRVRVDGRDVPAHETEYAADPVFGFRSAVMPTYVADASRRSTVLVPLEQVRSGGMLQAVLDAPSGAVVVPDVLDDDDVRLVARAVREAVPRRSGVLVRCASPLAAELAGVAADGLLSAAEVGRETGAEVGPVLVVCGSHTEGARRQLAQIADRAPVREVDSAVAVDDPQAAAAAVVAEVAEDLGTRGLAVLATGRTRDAAHGTLHHGAQVQAALQAVVREVLPHTAVLVSKGGITSADVATDGQGARRAVVLGQVLTGVSLWRVAGADGRDRLQVVVPGNVGDDDTLARALEVLEGAG